jgi:Mg2+-importing ATPase
MALILPTESSIWQSPPEKILGDLHTSRSGLSPAELIIHQTQFGPNSLVKKKVRFLRIMVRQLTSNPLIIILTVATLASYFLGQQISSYYIFTMIILSIVLGFWNEYSAARTVESLLKKISLTALVSRSGEKLEIPVRELTVGDIVYLSPGSIIPADLRLIEAKNLELNQSTLTGEAKTVFKTGDSITTPKNESSIDNLAYMGTLVENGTGVGVVFRVGKNTSFGKIAEVSSFIRPVTDFQKGLTQFGNLIIKVIVIMTITIFGVNLALGHPMIDSLLFSLAIAVGLTPELLPVIVTVSLAHGAGLLAKKHIIAKQLISIENLGNMDVLCTDKTGTLTEGRVNVTGYFNEHGKVNPRVLELSLLCNTAIIHHKVLGNAIDVALWEYALKHQFSYPKNPHKLADEPFDYDRKAMYTVIEEGGVRTLIVKGAPDNILRLCRANSYPRTLPSRLLNLSRDGLRMVAVATKKVHAKTEYTWGDAAELDFIGYVTFLDIPKKSAKDAIDKLRSLSVVTKIVTGDNEIVTGKVCREIGLSFNRVLLGSQIAKLTDAELQTQVQKIDIFARVTPEQKLRIIEAFQKSGHTVGYLGDGINDLPSLHSADVGISVNSAVDVAKDAAAIVLLRKSLDVIADGITEGRKTFSNTMKYILMATSSNFGNMFSAAGASFFLPFLPMTPVQILVTNGLYDLSQTSIPSDNVDPESLIRPRHWDIHFIRQYMIFFGPLSSIFDFATYGVMIFVFHASSTLFQTGWFIESIATEILIVFVIRTSRSPFFKSRPSPWLLLACLGLAAIGIILPFSPLASSLGFVAPPPLYFLILVCMIATYLVLVETVKSRFLQRLNP